MDEISVDEAIMLDVAELQKLLGADSVRKRLAAKPPSDDQLREIGRKHFNSLKPLFQEKICKNKRIQQILQSDADEKLLATIIMDIGSSIITGIPLILISSLIVKIGLKHFCAS